MPPLAAAPCLAGESKGTARALDATAGIGPWVGNTGWRSRASHCDRCQEPETSCVCPLNPFVPSSMRVRGHRVDHRIRSVPASAADPTASTRSARCRPPDRERRGALSARRDRGRRAMLRSRPRNRSRQRAGSDQSGGHARGIRQTPCRRRDVSQGSGTQSGQSSRPASASAAAVNDGSVLAPADAERYRAKRCVRAGDPDCA